MKKTLTFFFLITLLLIPSCKDDTEPPTSTGSIFISSEPGGADIFVNENFTGKETPALIDDLAPGLNEITLKVPGFIDTTFSVSIKTGFQESADIKFSPAPGNPDTIHFSGIKLYQQSAYYQQGLDLSTGEVVDAISPAADIFFDGSQGSRDLKSQHLKATFTTNYTYFFQTTNDTLDDGRDSPAYPSDPVSWLFNNQDNNRYSFLYNKQKNYIKLKVRETGNDGPFLKFVILDYIYNNVPRDVRF